MPPLVFLTDFGTSDWFVSSMKGVAAGICPNASLIDITHHIPPGDIRTAAFVLKNSYRAFPANTVFVIVVDPGVGGSRAAIIARAGQYRFVAPDNGVLSYVLREHDDIEIRKLENDRYRHHPVSATFHGRDIFAPAGAHALCGVSLESFGDRVDAPVTLEWPPVLATGEELHGEIVYIDRFGNAFTNIDTSALDEAGFTPSRVVIGRRPPIPWARFYGQREAGECLALVNSAGYVEVAVNGGSAAEHLGLTVGMGVILS